MTAHVHAANMALFAQDAAETGSPWLRWEISTNGLRWQDLHHIPIWDTSHYYRRKQPMRNPVCVYDVRFEDYIWFPHPASIVKAHQILAGSQAGQEIIKEKLAHRTQEDALAHAEAMFSIATGC